MAQGKHEAPASSRRSPWIVAGIVIAVVAIAGIAFIVFRGGNTDAVAEPTPPSSETPGFDFDIRKQVGVSTVTAETKGLKEPTKDATAQAADLLNAVYAAGYLDPANWREGTYGTVLAAFDEAARVPAEADLEALTAGADAGTRFTEILPGRSTLKVKVLLGQGDEAVAIEATAAFNARATGVDGTQTRFKSSAVYFMQPTEADWKITAFEVERKDTTKDAAVASPSGSAS